MTLDEHSDIVHNYEVKLARLLAEGKLEALQSGLWHLGYRTHLRLPDSLRRDLRVRSGFLSVCGRFD
jgi:hypothetical protein